MEIACCSKCERENTCQRHWNNITHLRGRPVQLISYLSYGSVSYSDNGKIEENACGEKGGWGMYIAPRWQPVPFPTEHLDKYLRGEIALQTAIDNTCEQVDKIIEEYIQHEFTETN